MSLPRFDLTTAGWLHVVDLAHGDFRRVGLTEALTRAHELRLVPDRPQESVVLLRLLLAVYDAAAGPADTDEWDRAWRAEVADPDGRVADYLATWRDRFDLYHPEHPFMQCGHLVEYRRGPEVLNPAYLGGAGGELFNPVLRDPKSHPPHAPEDAAVNLLVLLGYDVAGIKGAPPGLGTRGKTYGAQLGLAGAVNQLYLRGRTLRETLLLNLPPRPRADRDAPLWERPCPPPGGGTRAPAGRLDYLTWPSRRIRLHADADGRVDAVAWHDGDRVEAGFATCYLHDHLAPSRVTDKGKPAPANLVDEHFGQPVPWEVARILHPWADPDTKARKTTSGVLDHAVGAARRGALAPDYPLSAEVWHTRYNTHGTVINGLVGGTCHLGPAGLHTGPHATRLAYLINATVVTHLVVRSKVRELLPHVPNAAERIRVDPLATERAWNDLVDGLGALPADGDPVPVQKRYRAALREQLERSLDGLPLGGTRSIDLRARLEAAIRGASVRLGVVDLPEPAEPAEPEAATSPRRGPGGRPSPEVTISGETKTVAEWARDPRCVVTVATLRTRLADGWDPQQALTTPATTGPKPKTKD